MDYDGKVVLVTGSSSGIGEAAARRFTEQGATVVLNSRSSAEAGERLASELPRATYVQGDVSDEAAARHLVDATLERHGHLDVLVNNAGTTALIPHHELDRATLDVWRRIFEVNVFGTWSVTLAAMPSLRASHGAIINVTSVAGLRPTGSSIPYAASKAALNHMTVLLAKVVGPEVRVNAVAPGLIETPWTEDWGTLHELVAALAPLKRSGVPEDVASLIVALAASPYLTGQVVAVDGGLSLVS
jgi:ketoreductase RED2